MEPTNYIPGVRRRQMTPLYDTLVIATTTAVGAKRTMFGSTAGSVGANLTNMTKAFELPGPEKFTLFALRFVPLDIAAADLIDLQINYVLRLIRGRAVELEAPVEYFASGAGQTGNGIADPRAVASLGENPIVIEGTDHFEVTLEGTTFTTTAALTCRVYLDGWFDKGVQ